MLKDLFTWWLERLRELVPPRMSGVDRHSGTTLLVEIPNGVDGPVSLSLQRRRNAQTVNTEALGRFPLGAAMVPAPVRRPPSRIVLRLPNDLLLGCDLTLPLAAERELQRVVGFEIDRVTPFVAAELFWSYAIRRRDRVHSRLAVQLFLITRASVQPLLDALAAAGIAPTLLEAAMPNGERVRLDPRGVSVRHSARDKRTNRVLVMVCALLILALAATPFMRQSLLMSGVENYIASLSIQVKAVEAARRRLAAGSAEVDVVAAERLRLGDTLAILAAVTDVLPDDTNLTDLSLRQGKLVLSGQSVAAARLLAALAANSLLLNPDFAAPVTRLNDGRGDQFAIRAEIVR